MNGFAPRPWTGTPTSASSATAGHSGSPFRRALEHPSGRCTRYSVAGLQPQSAAASHLRLVRARASAFSGAELSADVVELCPRLDRDEQTARLAALTVWEILRGLAARR